MRKFAIAFACLGAAACTPAQIQTGVSIGVQAVDAATAPLCSAIAKGKAAPTTLCVDSIGNLVSILNYAAQNGIRAHLKGARLIYDGRK